MSTDPEQERLLQRLRRRDEVAFTEFVRIYQDRVFALCVRMLNNRAEAEDVSQDVFVAVFKNIDSFRGDAQLSTWLYRIAANHCRNRIRYLSRRNHRQNASLDDTWETEVNEHIGENLPRPDRVAEGKQLESIIQQALAELDEDQRLIVILRDVDHLSYAEIGDILDLAEGTVKSRLFRARLALRDRVSREYGDD